MKNLIFALIIVFPFLSNAQGNTSGVITYSEVMKMEWTPPADMDPAMKAQIEQMMKNAPKSFTTFKELSFNSDMAYYKLAPKQEKLDAERAAQANMEGGRGMGFRRMMMGGASINYWDLKKGKYVDQKEFFEKQFLIKDEIPKLQWKIMGEAKQIAGFVCQKAVTKIDTNVVTGWFCPTIPISAGPSGIGQLPGLILELQLDPRTLITADSISLAAIDPTKFEQPKGGKVVSKAEYDQIAKEKMEEMRAEWKSRMQNGGGHMRSTPPQ